MGINASTQKQKVVSILENNAKANCKTSQNVQQTIQGLSISLVDSNCKDINVQNRAKVASQCELGAMASALAKASMDLSADQTATLGLGMNINTSEQERQSIIKNKIEANCGSDQNVKQTIEGQTISLKGSTCNDINVMNDLDATSQCVLKLAFDAVDQSAAKGSTKQVVKFPLGLSIGLGLGVVGIVVIAVIIFMVVKGKKKGEQGEAGEAGAGAAGETGPMQGVAGEAGPMQGGRRRRRRGRGRTSVNGGQINWKNVPITVLGIMMLVWYAKMTDRH